ncbi:MAG: hypothetical protein NTV34_21830 [Proteobacteria bacterium]|nr:hypothetical protein [Pseudomonadota bacterium]
MLETSVYHEALSRLDYAGILAEAHTPTAPLDHYIRIRSAVVLGLLDEATTLLEAGACTDPDFHSLLQKQISIYSRQHIKENIEALKAVSSRFRCDTFLAAETEFTISYGYFITDKNQLGLPHLHSALRGYSSCGLFAHQAVALFNLAVIHNHLSDQPQVSAFRAQFSNLAASQPVKPVVLHHLRLEAYLATDRENFVEALRFCLKLLDIARGERRHSDFAGIASLTAYIMLKLRKVQEFRALVQECQNQPEPLPVQIAAVFPLMEATAYGLSDSDAALFIESVVRAEIDTTNKLFVLDLLAEAFERSERWQDMLDLAKVANSLASKGQQSTSLVDFRRYVARAYLSLGDLQKSEVTLATYEARAVTFGAEARIERAKSIRVDLNRLQISRHSIEDLDVLLDTRQHCLNVKGVIIDLGTQPLIERLYTILVRRCDPIPLEALFEELYGLSYRPDVHAARLKTLLDRARKVVCTDRLIVRRDGNVELNAKYSYKILGLASPNSGDQRRAAIIAVMKQADTPLGVSDLERALRARRRTIQLDLNQLIENGSIKRTGYARRSRYQVQRSNDA